MRNKLEKAQVLALLDAMLGEDTVGVDSDGNEIARLKAPHLMAALSALLGAGKVPSMMHDCWPVIKEYSNRLPKGADQVRALANILEDMASVMHAAADQAKSLQRTEI